MLDEASCVAVAATADPRGLTRIDLLSRLRADIDGALKQYEESLQEQFTPEALSAGRQGLQTQSSPDVDPHSVSLTPRRDNFLCLGSDEASAPQSRKELALGVDHHPFSVCDDTSVLSPVACSNEEFISERTVDSSKSIETNAVDLDSSAPSPTTPSGKVRWGSYTAKMHRNSKVVSQMASSLGFRKKRRARKGWVGKMAMDNTSSSQSTITTMLTAVMGSDYARPVEDTRLKRFTTRWEYETLRALCIVLDALLIGIETELASLWARAHPNEATLGIKDDVTCIVLSDLLTLYFLLDIALRVKADRYDLSIRAAGGWRWFNITVVFTCVLQTIAHHAYRDQRGVSTLRAMTAHLSALRIIRLFQISSVSPAIRNHEIFHELRIMIFSLTGAIKSFFWSSVMLLVVFVIFGVFFVEGALVYCVRNHKMVDESTEKLRSYFGTLFKAILTLNQSITGGLNWTNVYDDLNNTGHLYGKVFLLFIAFAIVALLNVVTAVFVGSTIQKAQNDRTILAQSEVKAQKFFLTNMQKVFREIDEDGNGEIGYDELRVAMEVPSIGAYFLS